MIYKTCTKCNKNFVLDNGELCNSCKQLKLNLQNVEQIKAIITPDLILSVLRVYFTDVYSKEDVEQALKELKITVNKKNIKPDPEPEPSNESITKIDATNLCNKNGLRVKDPTFASKNKTVDLYWANPPLDCIKRNWWLILNDNIRNQLHVFYIPAHTISSYQLEQRKDKIKPPCWNIKINYNDSTFEESVSKIKFLPWFIKTISY